eukprot:TRINITY_DN74661_c0_g1_i1.p1 TRINITY_DN74661_c0_g1~~TRINITY_DN74661_c0_g1_i1.p1  ORF type:complete len:285 (-),score=31.57 TRINITY_DN74661_c0_g1_i1:262-1077(-)
MAPTRRIPRVIRFKGKSSTSFVDAALRRGRMRPGALNALKRAWEEVTEQNTWQKEKNSTHRQKESFFRMNESVPGKKTNGGDWRKLAPLAAQQAWAELAKQNSGFYQKVKKLTRAKYSTNKGPQKAFEAKPEKALFAYAAVQRRWLKGRKVGTFHCDGGPSLIFLAITLEGERILEVEDSNGQCKQIHLRAGDWYLSSPACFWHRLLPVKGGESPCTTLILRSALLTRRLSGGREAKDGKRSHGMPYATKACFEKLASSVADIIESTEFTV